MSSSNSGRIKGLFIFLGIFILGAVILVSMAKSRKAPALRAPGEQALPARCFPITPKEVIPRVVLRGEVRAANIWSAVAETSGRIISRNPRLAKGAALEKDAELLTLDPFDYQVNLTRAKAETEQLTASLDELDTRQENLGESLALEKERLSLVDNEYTRQKNLLEKNSTSKASLDKARLDLLAQKQKCVTLQQSLDLLPTQRKAISARLKAAQANASEAERLLERTVIRMPFTGRIGQVALEEGQFIPKGQSLFKVYGTDMAEIGIRCTFREMKSIIPFEQGFLEGSKLTDPDFVDSLGLKATVRLNADSLTAQWEARVSRLDEGLDPTTRTIGIILEVKDPYKQMLPGKRPPLFPGMFVEAEISGPPRQDRVVLPLEAYRDGFVNCLDPSNRLHRVIAEPEMIIGEEAVFNETFKGFPMAVLSDLPLPIEGMTIDPVIRNAQ